MCQVKNTDGLTDYMQAKRRFTKTNQQDLSKMKHTFLEGNACDGFLHFYFILTHSSLYFTHCAFVTSAMPSLFQPSLCITFLQHSKKNTFPFFLKTMSSFVYEQQQHSPNLYSHCLIFVVLVFDFHFLYISLTVYPQGSILVFLLRAHVLPGLLCPFPHLQLPSISYFHELEVFALKYCF